jgi:hypothetical protein
MIDAVDHAKAASQQIGKAFGVSLATGKPKARMDPRRLSSLPP